MPNIDGHIFAPVSIADVSHTLGLSSQDLGTLCMSDRVNPHSLIRPVLSIKPNIIPADMENGQIGAFPADSGHVSYEKVKWGYFVPFVTNPVYATELIEKPWVRHYPTATTFKVLNQFDGYLDKVTPTLMVDPVVNNGLPIKLNIFTPGPTTVLSATKTANPGGCVSVTNVFSNYSTFKVGCSIFSGIYPNVGNVLGHFQAEKTIGESLSGGLAKIQEITTNITTTSNALYTIIPWVTNAGFSGNNLIANSRFYNLQYSDDFIGYINVVVPNFTIAILMSKDDVTKVGYTCQFTITIKNQYDTAKTVTNFKVMYRYGGATSNSTALFTTSELVTVPANSEVVVTRTSTTTDLVMNFDKLSHLVVEAMCDENKLQSPNLAFGNLNPNA